MYPAQLISSIVLLSTHWSVGKLISSYNNYPSVLIIYIFIALDCIHFEYVEQPSDMLQAELPCSPYYQHTWQLRMRCIVKQQSTTLYTSFDIHWFQKANGKVIDHGRPGTVIENGNNEQVVFGEQWLNMPPSDGYLGEYWCQIVANTSDFQKEAVYLGTSNSIIVHEPAYYDQFELVCLDIVRSSDLQCGDNATSITPSNTSSSG